MKTRIIGAGICVVFILIMASPALSQSVPQLINYQGRLTNAAGQPLADGSTVDLAFVFYGAAAGSTAYLTVIQEDVLVTGGLYNVLIGSGTITPGSESALAAVFQKHPDVWMGVKADADPEMTPRSRIASVPYAITVDPSFIGEIISKPDWDKDGFNKPGDCNDGNPSIYPGAPEICDGKDNQCPWDPGYGFIDEGCPGFCTDMDNDSYFFENGCGPIVDCNDHNANTWDTYATCHDDDWDSYYELCNAYNDIGGPDCDDTNFNVWSNCATCHDADFDMYYELCDYYYEINGPDCDDNNINADTCATCNDADADTYYEWCNDYIGINGPDCDDGDSTINPGKAEVCNDSIDNDCDGYADGNDFDCNYHSPMALIPSGCFNMGDAFSEGTYNELPVHNVCITSDFYMDVHEVTNAEYAACVSGGGCTAPFDSSSYSRGSYYGNPTYDNFPVIYVSWNQATAYCTWAGKRLPTEAEWEYAARGGLSAKRFPWGDTISCANANYLAYPSYYSYDVNPTDGYCISDTDTSQVESYAANGYGLYDMAGNVWEWTNDWYSSTYYSSSPTNDPPGPATGTFRVLRGGSWSYDTDYLRVSNRYYSDLPLMLYFHLGFRCAGD